MLWYVHFESERQYFEKRRQDFFNVYLQGCDAKCVHVQSLKTKNNLF